MSELLGLPQRTPGVSPTTQALPASSGMHPKLVKADYHGSIMTGMCVMHSICISLTSSPTVRQSKNPCLVGLSGIVIHETENAFKVVTRKDQLKRMFHALNLCSAILNLGPTVIPKENTIFAFSVPLYSTLPPSYKPNQALPFLDSDTAKTTVLEHPHLEFELHGNQFRFRSADRAGRKFKHKETIEL